MQVPGREKMTWGLLRVFSLVGPLSHLCHYSKLCWKRNLSLLSNNISEPLLSFVRYVVLTTPHEVGIMPILQMKKPKGLPRPLSW